MQRASNKTLQRRTILRASRLSSPQKGGISKADEATLMQRKIVKPKRSSFGTPSSPPPATNSPQRSGASVPDPSTPQDAKCSTPPKATPTQEPNLQPSHPSSPSSAPGRPTEEEVVLEIRAKLFARADSSWVLRGKGIIRCCSSSDTRSIKLLDEKGVVVEIRAWRHRAKVIKETSKGRATYVRFTAVIDAMHGEESFLVQTKPELLDKLYRALA